MQSKNRINAAIIDIVFSLLIAFIIFVPVHLTLFFIQRYGGGQHYWFHLFDFPLSLLIKDAYGQKSIGKHFMNVNIIDISTNQSASRLKRLIRNLTIIIAPLEFIFILINPSRRLGDLIAGTKLR